jgi:UDP-glucose 4-epimerase
MVRKTALVTGGAGYLGSHVIKKLKQHGWTVICYDKVTCKNRYADMYIVGDICDYEKLKENLSKIHIDVVFHLAGRIEVEQSFIEPELFYYNNVVGTSSLVRVMSDLQILNIVYASSASVYATPSNRVSHLKITEVNRCTPGSPYANSKYMSEKIIKDSELNRYIFRFFNLAGADVDGEFGECHNPETHLIPSILKNLNNLEFTINGEDYDTKDGTCIRDYVHVEDIAEACLLAADNLIQNKFTISDFTLNLGTGTGHSVLEIIRIIEKITNQTIKIKPGPRRSGDSPILVADISSAKHVLNYEPKHDIHSIIKTAYNWTTKQ